MTLSKSSIRLAALCLLCLTGQPTTAGERLGLGAAESLVSGNTAWVENRGQAQQIIRFYADGNLTRSAVHDAGTARHGAWWVEDDGLLCMEMRETRCFYLVKGHGGEVSLVDRDGVRMQTWSGVAPGTR